MDKKTTDKILQETETGYDLISQKFSQTRKHFWRGLEFLKDYVSPDSKILDYGCGNGRLLELIGDRENLQYHGVDVSERLLEIAKQKYVATEFNSDSEFNSVKISFSKIDPVQSTLAFDDNFFNTVYSIAVFHHFPSRKYRQEIANELYRVSAEGAHIIITVWYLWQGKYIKNILQNWKNKIFGKSALDWNDCEITFTDNSGKKFARFHHAFTQRELKKLFAEAGFEIERCDLPDGRNIVLIGKKIT